MNQDTIDDLLTEAESGARALLDREEFDDATRERLEELAEVAAQAADLLETVEVAELADALDMEDVPEAVEVEELAAAVEERDPQKAVRLRRLVRLADLSQVLSSVDLVELKRESDELSEAIDDVGDDQEGDGDDDGLLAGDDGDGGLLDGDDDVVEAGEEMMDDATDALRENADVVKEELDGDDRAELTEAAVQSKIDDAVGEFRRSLVEAHHRIKSHQAEVRERTRSQRDQPDSLNPTAHSTMAKDRADRGGAARFSTVPRGTRHSDAPARERIYGDRFERWTDDG